MENETLRFEDAMLQLEDIVKRLESGDVPLEEAINLYKKGMELSAYCNEKLQDAEKQLVSLIDRDGTKKTIEPGSTDADE